MVARGEKMAMTQKGENGGDGKINGMPHNGRKL
jgi:hypothetical protein